jgi:hypothetical protein
LRAGARRAVRPSALGGRICGVRAPYVRSGRKRAAGKRWRVAGIWIWDMRYGRFVIWI